MKKDILVFTSRLHLIVIIAMIALVLPPFVSRVFMAVIGIQGIVLLLVLSIVLCICQRYLRQSLLCGIFGVVAGIISVCAYYISSEIATTLGKQLAVNAGTAELRQLFAFMLLIVAWIFYVISVILSAVAKSKIDPVIKQIRHTERHMSYMQRQSEIADPNKAHQ